MSLPDFDYQDEYDYINQAAALAEFNENLKNVCISCNCDEHTAIKYMLDGENIKYSSDMDIVVLEMFFYEIGIGFPAIDKFTKTFIDQLKQDEVAYA